MSSVLTMHPSRESAAENESNTWVVNKKYPKISLYSTNYFISFIHPSVGITLVGKLSLGNQVVLLY